MFRCTAESPVSECPVVTIQQHDVCAHRLPVKGKRRIYRGLADICKNGLEKRKAHAFPEKLAELCPAGSGRGWRGYDRFSIYEAV